MVMVKKTPLPLDVLDLLWFSDGKYKNYDPEKAGFPTYVDMSSEQRWIYLNWLINVDSLIDTGYVFVFCYGLERHLFGDKLEEAFKMILRLRKNHKNNSFLNYSSKALLASILFH